MDDEQKARLTVDGDAQVDDRRRSGPTLEEIHSEYQPTLIKTDEEVTELVGLCLWDVFSDSHDVIAADSRTADIGSFRGTGAFLDEHLTRGQEPSWREGDYLRFHMGTIWISRRADLTPVYAMICTFFTDTKPVDDIVGQFVRHWRSPHRVNGLLPARLTWRSHRERPPI